MPSLKEAVKAIKCDVGDVLAHGCISGAVVGLTRYTDTTAFFRKHKKEIIGLMDGRSPAELFGNEFDQSDPFCDGAVNQNLLAWWAFETTLHRLVKSGEVAK